ncbi:hypothetical protein [Acinetobacter pittii]|uniref:hypothetical protein n=1 Tax=Acinetobacter pittii TaxID=48296 RepID=UPI00192ADD3A|nr:hypothetical protein [Acinetobacter pittii]HCA5337889.1 hypothetical protein [Acinetobacter baumannii]
MKLSDFQKKLVWGVGILSIICLWIAFPLIFKALIESYKLPKNFNEFGPFGDIYGSLNTLISSIALCAVSYSTYLQVTSIKETRVANELQLKLAQQSHDEQVRESRNAIFANQFYSLLNFKKDKFNSLEFGRATPEKYKLKALAAIQYLNQYFYTCLSSDPAFFDKYSEEQICQDFWAVCNKVFTESISPLISYFYLYKNLLKLIQESDLDPKAQALYLDILSNSMFQEEQLFIFWISAFMPDLKKSLDNSRLLNQIVYEDMFKNYGLRFHYKKTFRTTSWNKAFEEHEKQNPA